MARFVVIRLLRGVLTLLLVSVVTFYMFFALPTDPAAVQCGKGCSTERIEQVRHALGLDKPKVVQYGEFMKGLFVDRNLSEGIAGGKPCPAPCLGYSFNYNEPVTDTLGRSFPITLSIVIPAFIIYIIIGVGLGVLSALRRGTLFDKSAVGFTLVGASMQIYSVGLLLMLVFCFTLKISPAPNYVSFWSDPLAWAAGLWIGWLSLAFVFLAGHARLARAQMLETMSEDFIRTARAKGLSSRRVHGRHALRAAITPTVTVAGLEIGLLLGGVAITETTTSVQGIGFIAVEAVRNGDFAIIMATVLISSVFVVVSVFLVDLLYAYIDPRIRLT